MRFEYFYEKQSENFSFYRIPKLLFTDGIFRDLSTESKVLYGLLLDRISLSRENGWIDERGRVYVYCTIKSVKESLNCGNTKACKLMKELDAFGLTERKKQGFCKPALIYVKDFAGCLNTFPESEFRDSQNENSCVPKLGIQDISKQESNKTKENNTEINKTYPILSVPLVDNPDALQNLYRTFPHDKDTLDSIFELIRDVLSSRKKTIRIAGDDRPGDLVRSRFANLKPEHIEYVLSCLQNSATDVRNIKQYILASLYNAALTMDCYFTAKVNYDLYGKRRTNE